MRGCLEVFLNYCTASLNCFLIDFLTVNLSSSAVSIILGGGGVAPGWENLGWLLRAEFVSFFPALRISIRSLGYLPLQRYLPFLRDYRCSPFLICLWGHICFREV